jgi:hypothetical protein
MPREAGSNQRVGNIGLYYVCYKLSVLGWNVMPTARNARGVDIVAYGHDAVRMCSIQVKALSKKNPVPLGGDMAHLIAAWFVICRDTAAQCPECFVMELSEVKERAHRLEKNGKVSYWLEPKDYAQKQYLEAWTRLGQP